MRSAGILLALTLVQWLSFNASAEACTCLPPDMNRSYDNADHVVHARILGAVPAPSGQRRYLAMTIKQAFKGCLPASSLVVVQTASSSAACGMSLQPGQDYLLHGRNNGRLLGFTIMQVGLCDANSAWSALSPEHLQFLNTRYVCCNGTCACIGNDEVQCFVDPCQVSSCDVEGATCSANYCGGCNAEWTDASGGRVCLPNATCHNPERRYVANSPEECQRVRFACLEGEAAFFDECGCGCVPERPSVTEPCRVSGCSGQLCLGPNDGDGITTCIFRPEYACYRSASCEPQASGACGWTPTAELKACLAAAQQ